MITPAATLAAGPAPRLDRRRVYIFPSQAGFTLAVMLLIILLGAINYDNALGYLLAFLLGGVVMVAMLHTYRNLAGLRFVGARAAPVFVGDTARFECVIDNDTPRPRLALTLKRWPRGLKREQRRYLRRFVTAFSMPPALTTTATVNVAAEQRGWLRLDRLALDTTYPLGILRAWAYFENDARTLVYPLPRGRLTLPYTDSGAHGELATSSSGADEFAGLRPYAPGDPVSAIAWKTLAKAQELMIKRFHGHNARRLVLSWAAVSTLGGTEERLSQLCAWVLEAERSGARYRLELPATAIDFDRGLQHQALCLAALALFEHRA